jgi:hypothetical protein
MLISKRNTVCLSTIVAVILIATVAFFISKVSGKNSDNFESIKLAPGITSQKYVNDRATSSTEALIVGCGKEGQRIDLSRGQFCCTGMKEISLPGNGEANTLCMNPADQKAGSACDSDSDCGSGLKCKSVEIGQTTKICGGQDGQKEGQPCIFDSDCALGYKCKFLNISDFTRKSCVNLNDQKDGAQCTFSEDCAPGYACVQYKCVYKKAGSICTFDNDCPGGLQCKHLPDKTDSICVNVNNQKEGAACIFDDDCASGYRCDRSGGIINRCTKKPASPGSSDLPVPSGSMVPFASKLNLSIGECAMFVCNGNISDNGINDGTDVIICNDKKISTINCVGNLTISGHADSSHPSDIGTNYACCNNPTN